MLPTFSMSVVRKHFWQLVRRGCAAAVSMPEEVGLERVHARGGEQDRRIERRRDERGRRQAPVAARLEERQEGLADLVGSHTTIVAHPTTTSPRSRHATWPGAAPCDGLAEARGSPSASAAGAPPARGSAASRRRPRPRRCAGGRPAGATVVVASAVRGPTVTVFARASVASTYSGSSSPPMPRPRRWPTVKWWWPRWRPTRRPARSTMSPGRSRRRAVAGEERARGPCRRGSRGPASRPCSRPAGPASRGDLAHLGLARSSPSGKRRRASEARRERGEHVALVLGRVGGLRAAGRRRVRRA